MQQVKTRAGLYTHTLAFILGSDLSGSVPCWPCINAHQGPKILNLNWLKLTLYLELTLI